MSKRGKSVLFDDYLREKMKDPEFKREWDALEPEFSIRRQLIELRLKRGITQQELAERVGTPRPSISRMEARAVKDLDFARRLADALDATLEIRFVPNEDMRARTHSNNGARKRKAQRHS